MSRLRSRSWAARLMFLALIPAGSATPASEESAATVARSVLDRLDATVEECTPEMRKAWNDFFIKEMKCSTANSYDERIADFELACARRELGFAAFKTSWEAALHGIEETVDVRAEPLEGKSWSKQEGRRGRSYRIARVPLEVAFEEKTGVILIAQSKTTTPEIIKSSRARPRYPERPRRAHINGAVTLWMTVETDGTVGHIEVLESSSPGFGFEDAARQAVRQWRYEPASRNGEVIPYSFCVRITWNTE